MAIETLNGIKYPTETTDTINSGTSTVGGILIDNDLNLGGRVATLETQTPKWFEGTERPTASLNPKIGDFYVQSNGILWRYLTVTSDNTTTTSWVEVASLAGPQGTPGAAPTVTATPTSTGYILTVVSGGQTANIPINNGITPEISVSQITGGHKITITSGGSTNEVNVIDGTVGTNGSSCTATLTDHATFANTKVLSITNTNSDGTAGQSYSCNIFQGANGSDGADGADGATILTGTAVTGTSGEIPVTVVGSKTGDIYINTSTYNFYKAVAANTWNYVGCLKGPAGQDGTNGSAGADGYTPTITVSNKVNGVQTLTVTNKTGSTTTTINDGITGWNEATLVDSSNVLSDGDSVYSSIGMTAASISVTNGWSVGHTARVGITFASSSTFSYPSTWICIGDDCSGGDFTFSQGSSYWLTIENKPDGTWMTAIKVPS